MIATVLVVAKAPVAGQAKTRLTPPATPRQAARIAAAALLDTLDAALHTGGRVVVALTGRLADAEHAGELRAALAATTVIRQRGDTFADRLANAHADAARHAGLPVLQIGMDTPHLRAATLDAALSTVDADAVLGPATDGGWWALGFREPRGRAAHAARRALRAVPMSRPDTGELTLRALRDAGLTVGLLQELSDVDTMADALAAAELARGSRFEHAVRATSAP